MRYGINAGGGWEPVHIMIVPFATTQRGDTRVTRPIYEGPMRPMTENCIVLADPNAGDPMYGDAMYDWWLIYEESRGKLAFAPETVECYACGGYDGTGKGPERRVTDLGTADVGGYFPTGEPVDRYTTYKLECGHTVF